MVTWTKMSMLSGLSAGAARMPEVVMGQGPLPSVPAGFASADARFGNKSALLSNISPYAYGVPDQLSTQQAYLNVPHRIQKIVTVLTLPHATPNDSECLALSHAIGDGDLAFVLRTTPNGSIAAGGRLNSRKTTSFTANAFVNLATVNYILAGMQNESKTASGREMNKLTKWSNFFQSEMGYKYLEGQRAKNKLRRALDFVRFHCVPFGISHGSEKQGGLHESIYPGSSTGVSNVNYVVSLLIDGHAQNMVNLWSDIDISAGDRLILTLKYCRCEKFVLNHYAKGTVKVSFPESFDAWQLVPEVYSNTISIEQGGEGQMYDHNVHGYWHVATSNVMCMPRNASLQYAPAMGKQTMHHTGQVCYRDRALWQDDTCNMRGGGLLDVVFCPTWEQFSDESSSVMDHTTVTSVNPLEFRPVSSRRNNDSRGIGAGRRPIPRPSIRMAAKLDIPVESSVEPVPVLRDDSNALGVEHDAPRSTSLLKDELVFSTTGAATTRAQPQKKKRGAKSEASPSYKGNFDYTLNTDDLSNVL